MRNWVTKPQQHVDLKQIVAPGLNLVWRNADYLALFLGRPRDLEARRVSTTDCSLVSHRRLTKEERGHVSCASRPDVVSAGTRLCLALAGM